MLSANLSFRPDHARRQDVVREVAAKLPAGRASTEQTDGPSVHRPVRVAVLNHGTLAGQRLAVVVDGRVAAGPDARHDGAHPEGAYRVGEQTYNQHRCCCTLFQAVDLCLFSRYYGTYSFTTVLCTQTHQLSASKQSPHRPP